MVLIKRRNGSSYVGHQDIVWWRSIKGYEITSVTVIGSYIESGFFDLCVGESNPQYGTKDLGDCKSA